LLNADVRATKKMPNPQTLKIGDRVRFISIPEEWNQPGYGIHRESISFMKRMIKRTSPLRVTVIDEFGTPWVSAITIERGKRNYHRWAITEETGWRMVVPRKKRDAQRS
jgi:hypothetical protein